MILEKFPEVQRLSPSEKLIFVSELWNDLEAHPSEVPVSREIIAELDRRMEHFHASTGRRFESLASASEMHRSMRADTGGCSSEISHTEFFMRRNRRASS